MEFPPATQAALEGLGKIVGSAIASFRAHQLERKTRAEIEAFIAVLPMAVWCVDHEGKVTMWNRSAERIFGWKAREALDCALPFVLKDVTDDAEEPPRSSRGKAGLGDREFECRSKDGALIKLRATVAPLPRVIGRGSSTMTLAEQIDGGLLHLLAELHDCVMTSEIEIARAIDVAGPVSTRFGAKITLEMEPPGKPSLHIVLPLAPIVQDQEPVQTGMGPDESLRLLVVAREGGERKTLVRILRGIGCSVAVCGSADQAFKRYCAAHRSRRFFDLVICELLMPVGPGGLDLAARLLKADPEARVILSADSPIVGYESHGLAGALGRPYTANAVRGTIAGVWARRERTRRRTG